VLANVTALGARATVIGVVGNDDAAEKLRSALSQNGVQKDETLVCDDKRPTTIKTRIIAQHQMIVRADREHRGQVNGQIERRVIAAAKEAIENADALVISDYDKGVVTPGILSEILSLAY